jgi:hypothetical protein
VQTKCPAAYGSCGGGVTTPSPSVTKAACAAADLADAQNACKGGFATAACQNFFSTIAGVNPSCSKCLSPFDYDFTAVTGIFNCVSPFVSATCNHNTGCVGDCVAQSCGGCSQQNKASCETQVRGQGGQCLSYLQSAGVCVGQALFNNKAAQFCSPQSYAGNYGNLLFIWDVIFGTARITRRYPPAFGLDDDLRHGPEPWLTQFVYPLRRSHRTDTTLGAGPHSPPA